MFTDDGDVFGEGAHLSRDGRAYAECRVEDRAREARSRLIVGLHDSRPRIECSKMMAAHGRCSRGLVG